MVNNIAGLNKLLGQMAKLDSEAMKAAQNRWDNPTKPLGSLGKLEELVVDLAGITCTPSPLIDKKAIVIM